MTLFSNQLLLLASSVAAQTPSNSKMMLSAKLVIAFFVSCWAARSAMSQASLRPEQCSPFRPTIEKYSLMNRYWKNMTDVPLYFWHLQKAGGSSFCNMMRQTYHTYNHIPDRIKSPDCNFMTFCDDLIANFSSWDLKYRPQGYAYVAMEASNHIRPHMFPAFYRQRLRTQILLNVTAYPKESAIVWNSIVHVLVIRHPLETALSAFNYRFQGTNSTMVSKCDDYDFNPDECMTEAFRILREPNITGIEKSGEMHQFWDAQQLHRIRTEILGNYSIAYLSLYNDLEDAKRTLDKFHLVIDVSMNSVSAELVRCTLGWSNIKRSAAVNKNPNPSSAMNLLDSLSLETLRNLRKQLKYEIKLYDYAIHFISKQHQRAMTEVYNLPT